MTEKIKWCGCRVVTEKIWLPFYGGGMLDGNQIFLITNKRGHVTLFWKTFYGDRKNSVATITIGG